MNLIITSSQSLIFYRNPANFHEGTDFASKGVDSPLLRIIPPEEFNIVDDVLLDSMHLFDLGISDPTVLYCIN